MPDEEKVTYFGLTDARNKQVRFGIKNKDRTRHIYTIGKTGMGKSTLLENLAIQDIQNGEGVAFVDPHGKSADLLLEYIPEHRKKDVVYFAPFDLDFPVAFNVLEDVGVTKRHLVANGLMSAFKTIWADAFSARMEYILNNIMLALLEYPGSTLMSVNRMLTDKEFRATVVANVTDPTVKAFWIDEYGKYTEKFAAEAAPAIQNKVGQFVGNPLVRNIIGQPVSGFDIREIMDNRKILIINLSKGRVGEANANLLGAMLITKIYLSAMSRADLNEADLKKAPQFYLYVDEFQNFANESFADILSEARKYKLSLTIANQYVEQMPEEVRAAVFGNVGTMITFRIGAYDAAVFEKEYAPEFTAEDLVNLQQYQMYLKLMIDGVSSRPFSATGIPPIARPEVSYVNEILDLSRAQFANPREKVEEDIRNWHVQKIGAKESVKKTSDRPAGDRTPSDRSTSDRPASDRPAQDRGREERGRMTDVRMQRSDRVNRSDRMDRVEKTDKPARSDRPEQTERMGREEKPDRSRERSERMRRASDEERPRIVGENIEQKNKIRPETPVVVKDDKISLNELSSNRTTNHENKVKNNQKEIKPENVAALREALLSVMGDDATKIETQKKEPVAISDDKIENKVDEKPVSTHTGQPTGQLTPDALKKILDIEE